MTYEKHVTTEDPNKLVLSDVPFRAGQRVKIVLTSEEEQPARVQELRRLFKTTQALPQAQAITEEKIASEIEAYRASRE